MESYTTRYFYLLSYLIEKGENYIDANLVNNSTTEFLFEQSKKLPEYVESFYTQKALVNPMSYGSFQVVIKDFVYDNLPLSKATKLREVYKADNIVQFLNTCGIIIHFHQDLHLLMAHGFELNHKDYAVFKSKLIIEIYTQ